MDRAKRKRRRGKLGHIIKRRRGRNKEEQNIFLDYCQQSKNTYRNQENSPEDSTDSEKSNIREDNSEEENTENKDTEKDKVRQKKKTTGDDFETTKKNIEKETIGN